jgi:hypothetical protein
MNGHEKIDPVEQSEPINKREQIEQLNWLIGMAVSELRKLEPSHELLEFAQTGAIEDEEGLQKRFCDRFGEGKQASIDDVDFMFTVAYNYYDALNKAVAAAEPKSSTS